VLGHLYDPALLGGAVGSVVETVGFNADWSAVCKSEDALGLHTFVAHRRLGMVVVDLLPVDVVLCGRPRYQTISAKYRTSTPWSISLPIQSTTGTSKCTLSRLALGNLSSGDSTMESCIALAEGWQGGADQILETTEDDKLESDDFDLLRADTRYHEKFCFHCGKQSDDLTRDHVPPRCFFPKGFRDGELITVPACERHNHGESETDEITRGIVALMTTPEALESSEAAEKAAEKTSRGLNRPDSDASNVIHTIFDDLPAGHIHRDVFLDGLGKIGRGLYYHIFREPWGEGEVTSHTPLLFDATSSQRDSAGEPLFEAFERVEPPTYGENPEVFRFQALKFAGLVTVRMVFFECVPVVSLKRNIAQKDRSKFAVEQLGLPPETLDVNRPRHGRADNNHVSRIVRDSDTNWQPVVRKDEWKKASDPERIAERTLELNE